MSENKEQKLKKKGPIRFEAIIPVLILGTIAFIYFSFYFDRHLKSLVEYVGTQANGAEVNVDSIQTSFIKGSFDLNKLEVTDKEMPTHNSIEIGNVHFKYLWDALLRMKFVVEDASINNIQLLKPRQTPGKILPPGPAKPSKINELEHKILAQVKDKYSSNMLSDIVALLEGGDYKDQVEKIRGSLKSEARAKALVAEVQQKKVFWDGKIKELSDTSRLKKIETEVQSISKEKNFAKQAEGIKKLSGMLNEVNKQYKEVQSASKQLQSEVNAVTQYPKELQNLINEDIASLKNHFSIPQLDFKDMAMHLFAGQFVQYIVKAKKYQALAEQYMPKKKNEEEEIIPPKRSEGKTYLFPITAGYPLFWLKRGAISSTGTAESYSGKVSGELTNVTTDPKYIKKPMVLDMNGDFPAVKVMGVKALFTIDHTRDVGKQTALLQVNSFPVPEKIFVSNEKIKFGFLSALGSTTVNATLSENNFDMHWTSALSKPQFMVETSNKIAKEMLGNILSAIPVININGSASGQFTDFKMHISSNLGTELGDGLKREIGAKVAEAQGKLNAMVEENITKPKEQLMSQIGDINKNLTSINGIQELYKKNEDKIKAEIENLKSGGAKKSIDDIKEKGKKLFKGIKF